jgi:hypothetical protein
MFVCASLQPLCLPADAEGDRVAHFGLEHSSSRTIRAFPENSLTQEKLDRCRRPTNTCTRGNGKYRGPRRFWRRRTFSSQWLAICCGCTKASHAISRRVCLPSEAASGASRTTRNTLAQIAAFLDNEPGRRWRPLARYDDGRDSCLILFAPGQWTAYRRSTDVL